MRINSELANKFSASTVHLEHITTALSSLTPFGSKDDVLIFIDADGLSFVRENNHVIKIQLLLSRELFMSYSYRNETEDHMKLCVKINHILDSVSVMNRNSDDIVECTLSYDGHGSPFVLIFEDPFISERVEYSTYLIKDFDTNGLELDRERISFEAIIKGEALHSALKDLKEIGCKECYVYAKTEANDENVFALISKSQLGFSKIKLPSNRSILEKLQVFDGDSTTVIDGFAVIGFFDFTSFDKIRKSTKIASKVLFRMDVHGVLSVNILSQTDDVIITDTTRPSNNRPGSIRQLQLPKDYPGIVIEVCMLEKESIDEAAQTEIELLMETNELGNRNSFKKSTIRKRYGTDKGNETSNDNLLQLNGKKIKLPSEEENNKNRESEDEENHCKYPTKDIPIFF
ncbi:AVN_collapsed_G0052410.mRNA.1.CDS.1 [Saccharomyces cerevisiae]|nr:AVN_collapsed_G0052410.mRNA.1.CDS.1 [Saccharomyces cerevisiae]